MAKDIARRITRSNSQRAPHDNIIFGICSTFSSYKYNVNTTSALSRCYMRVATCRLMCLLLSSIYLASNSPFITANLARHWEKSQLKLFVSKGGIINKHTILSRNSIIAYSISKTPRVIYHNQPF